MNQREHDSFPPGVASKLKTYAYRLIDPRNGETFYVGKGRGNRVFSHIRGEQDLEGDDLDNKIKRIREIRVSGFEVAHVIHRHGMDERTAFEVEAAPIDAYPGLTNIVGGTGGDYGAMHAEEIIRRYSAEPAKFQHKALLISVNRSAAEKNPVRRDPLRMEAQQGQSQASRSRPRHYAGLDRRCLYRSQLAGCVRSKLPWSYGVRWCPWAPRFCWGGSPRRHQKALCWQARARRVSEAWRCESDQVHLGEKGRRTRVCSRRAAPTDPVNRKRRPRQKTTLKHEGM